ncbi:MAG: septum formation inhibitor Maf [Chthonomonas sp.]|nr:septum formation inhibitor Maf [Chthonomonas sp.]
MRPPNLKWPVILASGSPRRRELLASLGVEFTVVSPEVDETQLADEAPAATAARLARDKAFAVFDAHDDSLVIAGDTVVELDGESLAKPTDAADAARMLSLLSGRTHRVTTALVLRWPKGFQAIQDTTEVTFRELTATEIESYVATGEPLDKAGGYAIQGGARKFVTEIRGSESNVIGLPIELLQDALRDVR